MNNEGSAESRSIDERLQKIKDNTKSDVAENRTRTRELAKHGVKSLLRRLTRHEEKANRAGVSELEQAQKRIDERASGAATDHRDAITSLAKESAASADADDPQAMVARHRLEQIRRELKSEQ